jgi:hypothetical protein
MKRGNQVSEQNQVTEYQPQNIVEENERFIVIKEGNKFIRKAKFEQYSSVVPKNREEKVWLLNLYEGDEETGNGLKKHIGKQIVIHDVITKPYNKINEETGALEYGVITYLITPEKQAFVTSSKSVYFSILNIMDLFGKPSDDDWEDITIKVFSEKADKGDMIKIKMIK